MKSATLTHEEACALVEGAIENCIRTLSYIRLRIERARSGSIGSGPGDEIIRSAVDKANLLCNINRYGAYLSGARAMARALEAFDLLDFPKKKTGHGGYPRLTIPRAHPIVNKAVYDLFLSTSRNLEWCLEGLPANIEILTDIERNKSGRITGAKAWFVKNVTRYQKV